MGLYDGMLVAKKMHPYVAGMRADTYPKATSTVYSDTAIGFGLALVQSNAFDKVELPSPANTKFVGIAEHQHLDPHEHTAVGDTIIDGYPKSYAINLATAGHWVVLLDEDVTMLTPSDKVFVRHTAGTGEKKVGQFRKDADAGAAVEWVGARWIDISGISKRLAAIEINFPPTYLINS